VIVVDTNVIAYLFLGGDRTPSARAVYKRDAHWAAPLLWRSEFRNVLATYLRQEMLTLDLALAFMTEAETLMQGEEYQVDSICVVRLLHDSKCSAYDCEFVVLAEQLNVSLVTSDARILKAFPETAISIEAYGSKQ
jgi:predicted nucleic acid-binding protein